jgi:DNA-binding response OmpR family regulator
MPNTVLLIQDDPQFESDFKEQLRPSEFNVTQAINGFHGLKLATSEKFDFIFVDLMLHQIDGLDVIRLLKWHPISQSSQLIAISRHHTPAQQAITLSAGATFFFKKPYTAEDLAIALQITR